MPSQEPQNNGSVDQDRDRWELEVVQWCSGGAAKMARDQPSACQDGDVSVSVSVSCRRAHLHNSPPHYLHLLPTALGPAYPRLALAPRSCHLFPALSAARRSVLNAGGH